MTVKVSVHRDLSNYPAIKLLAKDFSGYKRNILVPDYFGRDGDYLRPKECCEEGVWHLHLCETTPPPDTWTCIRNLFSRKSDIHLVYCCGFYDPNHYLLITVLTPDAHRQANNIDRMLDIAAIAAGFRENV